MAPLEWLTAETVARWLDSFGVVLYLVLGLGALYLGVTTSGGVAFFGVDVYLWLGVGWLLMAVYWWTTRRLRLDWSDRA